MNRRWNALVAAVFVAVPCSATAIALGRPEAWAVLRLDGIGAVPWELVGTQTCYARSFTHAAFLLVAPGNSKASVRAVLGEPLAIRWSLKDDPRLRSVDFELRAEHWVVAQSFHVDVTAGTPIDALESLRPQVVQEEWLFARSCSPSETHRMRTLTIVDGRVARRVSGMYFD
jgi:hypothetical protein